MPRAWHRDGRGFVPLCPLSSPSLLFCMQELAWKVAGRGPICTAGLDHRKASQKDSLQREMSPGYNWSVASSVDAQLHSGKWEVVGKICCDESRLGQNVQSLRGAGRAGREGCPALCASPALPGKRGPVERPAALLPLGKQLCPLKEHGGDSPERPTACHKHPPRQLTPSAWILY